MTNALIERKLKLEITVERNSEKLNQFPKNEIGLVPNDVKKTTSYKDCKKEYEKNFELLRVTNSQLTNKEKRELSKLRRINKNKEEAKWKTKLNDHSAYRSTHPQRSDWKSTKKKRIATMTKRSIG